MSLKTLASVVTEEMQARGWDIHDLAARCVLHELRIKTLELEMLFELAEDPSIAEGANIIANAETLAQIDAAFGVSQGFCLRVWESVEPTQQVNAGATPSERGVTESAHD